MMREPFPLIVACVIAASVPSMSRAAEHTEFWPELQAWVRLNQSTQVLINPAPVRSRETGERTSADLGIYLDHRSSESVAYRIGYVHSVTDPTAPETKSVEHRISLDYTYRWKIGAKALLSDRTRVDLRERESGFSQRLRNRLQFEQETRLGELDVVPYANAELFYDTRFSAFARYRFEGGADFVLTPQVDVTLYVGRQTDTKPERQSTNGFGIILGLHF